MQSLMSRMMTGSPSWSPPSPAMFNPMIPTASPAPPPEPDEHSSHSSMRFQRSTFTWQEKMARSMHLSPYRLYDHYKSISDIGNPLVVVCSHCTEPVFHDVSMVEQHVENECVNSEEVNPVREHLRLLDDDGIPGIVVCNHCDMLIPHEFVAMKSHLEDRCLGLSWLYVHFDKHRRRGGGGDDEDEELANSMVTCCHCGWTMVEALPVMIAHIRGVCNGKNPQVSRARKAAAPEVVPNAGGHASRNDSNHQHHNNDVIDNDDHNNNNGKNSSDIKTIAKKEKEKEEGKRKGKSQKQPKSIRSCIRCDHPVNSGSVAAMLQHLGQCDYARWESTPKATAVRDRYFQVVKKGGKVDTVECWHCGNRLKNYPPTLVRHTVISCQGMVQSMPGDEYVTDDSE
ncbi:uncharacterized protein BP01DRAFT_397056 [Aspergillus saccharolyticus JOP 1030-1]|uniref:Uncharacterized protein n=1 Tax=Aspergillus saccharolyticus JOP 1030-1 TaxID=1450539 RepID=A0A318ZQ71_9EURO|nr:hypothetical protein BP01DRAFT_397056 [Aspergillus saccharolyticus JOP 1030-1]PYH46563.1 hypothetical protein BP01DRAFT_397056 [Aspergillus saccharolyticus JOP 1030-1]